MSSALCLAGYDWGDLASCVAPALSPERVAGPVSYAGYDVVDVKRLGHAYPPALEQAAWYQHLYQHARGRECSSLHRRELCRMLRKRWSPTWTFDDATFERTAASFDNPDFVDVVLHSQRFGFGPAEGDPALAALEAKLAEKPPITVPTITIDGMQDPLKPGGTADHASMFTGRHRHRVVDCGHDLPGGAPREFSDAVLAIEAWSGDLAP